MTHRVPIMPRRVPRHPKQKRRYWRGDVASFFCLKILTTTRAPPLVTTPYRARHPSSRCALSSCWITHEAQSVKASVIYRAASRCESWGNKPAHDFPCLACVLYPRFTLYPAHTCRPQDLQLYLSYRVFLSSKSLGCMKPCRAGSIPHVVASPL